MLLITRYKHMLSLIRKTLHICMLTIPKLIVANSFFHLSLLNEIMLKECHAQIIMLNVGKMAFAGMKKKIPTKVHLPKLGLRLYDLEPHSLGTKNTEYKFLSAPNESI